MKKSDWSLAVVLCVLAISMATCTAFVYGNKTNYYDVQVACVKATNDKYCNK